MCYFDLVTKIIKKIHLILSYHKPTDPTHTQSSSKLSPQLFTLETTYPLHRAHFFHLSRTFTVS